MSPRKAKSTKASILEEQETRGRRRWRRTRDLETINEENESEVHTEQIPESEPGSQHDTESEVESTVSRGRSADGEPVMSGVLRSRQARRFSSGTSEEPREQLPEEHAMTAPQVEFSRERETPRENVEEERSSHNASSDRTSVNLGDTESVTDWQRFLRKEWGIQGTMLKVMKLIHRGVKPLTVKELVKHGPIIGGASETVLAAACFKSLLKLKEQQFLELHQGRNFAITDISFGRRVRLLLQSSRNREAPASNML